MVNAGLFLFSLVGLTVELEQAFGQIRGKMNKPSVRQIADVLKKISPWPWRQAVNRSDADEKFVAQAGKVVAL